MRFLIIFILGSIKNILKLFWGEEEMLFGTVTLQIPPQQENFWRALSNRK